MRAGIFSGEVVTPTLRERLSLFLDENYIDRQMEHINWETMIGILSSEVSEMVKLCQWRGKDCLDIDLWTVKVTRIGQCFELDIPEREVSLATETLRFVFGKN